MSESNLQIKHDEQEVLIEQVKDGKGTTPPKPLLDKNSFWDKISKINAKIKTRMLSSIYYYTIKKLK